MPDPADSTTTHTQEAEFDPLEFWIRYKSKIQLYGGLLVVALVAFGAYEWMQQRTKAASEAAYASAQTADDFRKVVSEYPRSVSAANAQLMLAEQLRKDGKIDDAISALRTFISQHPDHQLIPGAYLSLGSLLENQGKADDALAAYQKVTTSYLSSYAAPLAWISQAKVLQSKGKTEEARRAYETVINKFQGSSFAREATVEEKKLSK